MEAKGKEKAKGGKRSRMNGGSGATTVERKEVERERRQNMKELCTKLVSLIPKEHCSSTVSTAECSLSFSYILIFFFLIEI